MTSVATQPVRRSHGGIGSPPITRGFDAMCIITIMTGPATMPLMTADQNSARIGSMPMRLSARPTRVAAASTP